MGERKLPASDLFGQWGAGRKDRRGANLNNISEVVNSVTKNSIEGKRGKGDYRFECNQVDSDACQLQHTLLIGVHQI